MNKRGAALIVLWGVVAAVAHLIAPEATLVRVLVGSMIVAGPAVSFAVAFGSDRWIETAAPAIGWSYRPVTRISLSTATRRTQRRPRRLEVTSSARSREPASPASSSHSVPRFALRRAFLSASRRSVGTRPSPGVVTMSGRATPATTGTYPWNSLS